MPVKPENKARYPHNWKEIRAAILHRAGHKCEFCGVQNHEKVIRGLADGDIPAFIYADTPDFTIFNAETGKEIGETGFFWNNGETKIVLTIAHLDHTPENNDPENLRALCQRCHILYDRDHHAANAKATLKAKKANAGQMGLFEAAKGGPRT